MTKRKSEEGYLVRNLEILQKSLKVFLKIINSAMTYTCNSFRVIVRVLNVTFNNISVMS